MFVKENWILFLQQLLEAGIVLAVGLIVIKVVLSIERKALEKSKLDDALYTFVQKATKILLLILLVIMTLQEVGVSTSSLIACLGAGGAAIALALKDSLGNVAGGIILLFTKPFKKGDSIEIASNAGVVGIVDKIDLLTTTLHTVDNKIMTVPNGVITNTVVTNYTEADTRRLDLVFGISYNSDIDQAKSILLRIADKDERILKYPEPICGLNNQGDSSLDIVLKVWCKTDDYYDLLFYIQEESKKEFDKAGIEIPFPQMDVHLKKE